MYAVVKNARIYFDVDGEGSTPAGAAMVEKPTLMVLHGGPGSDHSYFKPWIPPPHRGRAGDLRRPPRQRQVRADGSGHL